MGKIFGDNKSRLIPFIFFVFILLSPAGATAAGREFELFDSAYEDYIAYQPEQAMKEFRTFLEEFPRSSAKDAAMFWLGRSLVHLESLEEAKQVFSALLTEFPESPFREYAEKEIDIISKIPSLKTEELKAEELKAEELKTEELKTEELKAEELKTEELKAEELKAEELKTEELKAEELKTEELKTEELKTEELKTEELKTEEAESSVKKPSEDVSAVVGERDELRPLFEEEEVENGKLQDEEEEVEKKEAYIVTSSFVLSRLGVTYIGWRSEDILKDIENEQILYEKAKSLNITADPELYHRLVEKYQFNSEQAEYLRKFLSICELVDMKLRDRQDERVVESLVVRYEEGDRYKKITSSTDLQKQAKSGMPFEDISKMHSDIVEFKTARFQDLEEWIKEKIFYLENNEIGVIWSEEGYMLLKPVVKKISCNPAETIKPGMKERIKTSVGELLQEIKGQDNSGTEKER